MASNERCRKRLSPDTRVAGKAPPVAGLRKHSTNVGPHGKVKMNKGFYFAIMIYSAKRGPDKVIKNRSLTDSLS